MSAKHKNKKNRLKGNENVVVPYVLPNKLIIILLIIITAISFYLRIINVEKLSLWVDEYVHVIRAKEFVENNGPLFTNDNNGILYTIFTIPFFYIFESSPFWARFPSVLFGAGSVLIIYLLGKQIFNKKIGLISSFLIAFSLYNIYWSRISRNYAIFMFFYLLVLLFFWKTMENENKSNGNTLLERNGINIKNLAFFIIFFVLSLLSHQLTFLFVFGLALYFITCEILILFDSTQNNFKNKYFVISVFSSLALIFIFMPFANSYVRDILSLFLPERIVNWVIPNWKELFQFYNDDAFKIFNKYFGVLKNDYKNLFWIGIVGIPLSFLYNRKGSLFLFSMFVVPFILMSFIFYDPALPRYLIFIYPLFLISSAAGLYYIVEIVFTRVIKTKRASLFALGIPLIVVVNFIPQEEMESLIKVKREQGFIVDRSLSEWSFTNWEYPCRYVKSKMKDGDIIFSTVPLATNYYLDYDSSIRFRQRYYDTIEKKYKTFEAGSCEIPCAESVEDIVNTLNNYEKGWLLADYYFYNVMTDPRARSLICRYLNYHPQGSNDGGVLVFSWDKKSPAPVENQTMLYVLGKSNGKINTDELTMNLGKGFEQSNSLSLYVYARSVSKNEMIILVNNKYKVVMPPTKSKTGMERLSATIKPDILKEGENTFKIFYNSKVPLDEIEGFSLHHIGITGS